MVAILSIEDVFNSEFGVDKEDFIARKTLDKRPGVIIIIFTAYRGRANAAKQARDRQASSFKATWHAQSPPSGCAPSLVRRQRFLRPGRHCTGQVRDAPAGPCRQPADFPGSPRFWVFTALFLSGELTLRASWVVGIGSFKARSQKRSQAHAGSDGVLDCNAKIGAVAELRSTSRPRKEGIRRPGSSPEHRAAASAGKKTPLRSAAAPDCSPLSNQAFVAGYEELRRQVLIREGGPGLAVLMRGGVRAWMSACSVCSAPLPTKVFTQTEAGPVIPQGLHTEIVLILAGMLLHRCQEARA